jgi:hypothetical protein
MLFDACGKDIFESHKERNLYFKFFCGYFFNEFVPGVDKRLDDLCRLLATPAYPTPSDPIHHRPLPKVHLSASTTHVSFDNYSNLFDMPVGHQGEFADIFVHDRAHRTLICIEAKLHSPLEYEKDIAENARRVNIIADGLGSCTVVHCLLLKASYLEGLKTAVDQQGSNWRLFMDDLKATTLVFTWEQFAGICDDPRVREYVTMQVNRKYKKNKYKVGGGSFSS